MWWKKNSSTVPKYCSAILGSACKTNFITQKLSSNINCATELKALSLQHVKSRKAWKHKPKATNNNLFMRFLYFGGFVSNFEPQSKYGSQRVVFSALTFIIFCTVLSTNATSVYIPPALTFDCPEHFCQRWDDSMTPACELHQPPSLGGPWNRERTAGALLQPYPFWTPSPTIHTTIRISRCSKDYLFPHTYSKTWR